MIKLYISVASVSGAVDYTDYIESGSLKIIDQINVPTFCDFILVNTNNTFQVPVRGAYVQVYSTLHNLYPFTGFITSPPEQQLLGVSTSQISLPRKYRYSIKCSSDEYLLNNKATEFVPTFVNQTKAQILAAIAETLAPGYFDVTSFAASGDVVPYFQYDPSQSWATLAKQFADDSLYRYKVINKKFYFQPHGATGFPIKYDSSLGPSTFDPYQMNISVLDNPLINDVIVLGAPEAGAYGSAIFIGDGFNSNFPLSDEVFRGETQLLFQEDWTGNDFNSQSWTVVDPGNHFQLFDGALNVVGGTGLGQSYILGKNGIELGGQLYLQHGQFVFTNQSSGIIGGVYTDSALQQTDCFCGFLVSASGASGTNVQPLLSGVLVGPVVGLNPIHQYVLITMINGNQQFRYNRAYRTQSGSQFGGDLIDSPGTITWAIYDIDPYSASIPDPWTYIPQNELPILTTVLTSYTESVSGMPGLGLYSPVNSDNLNFAANTLMTAQPPQATLYTYTSPVSAGIFTGRVQDALGFGLLPTLIKQVASLVQGQKQSTSQLSFYNDSIPFAQEVIELRYRVSQQSVSRVIDTVSVAQQAVLAGDDGHRGTIQQKLSPQPRSSEECDAAAQAFILDAEEAIYTGTYNCSYLFTNYSASGYPVPGCNLYVNDPDRGISQNFLVQKVTSTYKELRGEIVDHFVEFGQDTYLNKTLNQFVNFPNTLRPVDTATPPLPQSLLDLAATGSFLADLDNITVLGLSCTGVNLDFGQVPASGVEVRTSDLGWGTRTVHNLIGVFTSQQVTLARPQVVMRFYFRMVNGSMTSRRTSIVQINASIPPPKISGVLNMLSYNDPALIVSLPLDLQNFFGVEVVRDDGTLLFRRDYLSDSDLTFHLNTSPVGFSPVRNPVLYLYAYNLMGCLSEPTIITTAGILGLSGGQLAPPAITNIVLDTLSSNMTWSVVFPNGLQPSTLYYDVLIDNSGTASFNVSNLAVSATRLQANHIYIDPSLVGSIFDAKLRGVDEAGPGDWTLFHWPGSLFTILPGASGGNQCLLNVSNLAASAECYYPCGELIGAVYTKLTFNWTNPSYITFGGVTVYIKNYLGQNVWRRWWTKSSAETYFTDLLIPTGETVDLAFVSFDTDGNENAIPYSPQILSLELTCVCPVGGLGIHVSASDVISWSDTVLTDSERLQVSASDVISWSDSISYNLFLGPDVTIFVSDDAGQYWSDTGFSLEGLYTLIISDDASSFWSDSISKNEV